MPILWLFLFVWLVSPLSANLLKFATISDMVRYPLDGIPHRTVVVAQNFDQAGDSGGGEFYLDRSGLLGSDAANDVTVWPAADKNVYWRRLDEPGARGVPWRWAGIRTSDDPEDAKVNGERLRHLIDLLEGSGQPLLLDGGRAYIGGALRMGRKLTLVAGGGVMVRADSADEWSLEQWVEDTRRQWIEATAENLKGAIRNGFARPEWFGASGFGGKGEHNAPHINAAFQLSPLVKLAGHYNIGSEPVRFPTNGKLQGGVADAGNIHAEGASILRRTQDGVGILMEGSLEHGKQLRSLQMENITVYGGPSSFKSNLVEARGVAYLMLDDTVSFIGPFPHEPAGGYRLFYGEQIWDSQFFARFMGGGDFKGLPAIEIRAGPKFSSNQLFFGARVMEGFRGTAVKIVGPANHITFDGRKVESHVRNPTADAPPVMSFSDCAVVHFSYLNVSYGGAGMSMKRLIEFSNCRDVFGDLTLTAGGYLNKTFPQEISDGELDPDQVYEFEGPSEGFAAANLGMERIGDTTQFRVAKAGEPQAWADAKLRPMIPPRGRLRFDHLIEFNGGRPKAGIDLRVFIYDGSEEVISNFQDDIAVWIEEPYDPERIRVRVYPPEYVGTGKVRATNIEPTAAEDEK